MLKNSKLIHSFTQSACENYKEHVIVIKINKNKNKFINIW